MCVFVSVLHVLLYLFCCDIFVCAIIVRVVTKLLGSQLQFYWEALTENYYKF
jgi:ABC-type sulfate transport system permease component